MQHAAPSCQLGASTPGDSRLISPRTGDTQCPQTTPDTHAASVEIERATDYSDRRFALVRGACQEVSHTKSRRSGPRRWRRAVEWLIAAGLHPRANATTLRIAMNLADRMDYDTGHVRYGLDDMAARLGISRASIARHVGYLRELGALAWVEHGSRANRLRVLGLKGYAGTATVYAAVIPAVYDYAMGHRIIGTGYEARIVVDLRDQPKPVDNPPVDNSSPEALETPSLDVVKESGQVQVVGGVTTTAARSRKTSTTLNTGKSSSRKRATVLGAKVTAAGMQLGDKLARAIRRRVEWTRRASHDQLRWVCADMAEQQWTEDQAVRFVVEAGLAHRAGFAWNPDRPHRLIAAELRAHQERQEQDRQDREARAKAVAWKDSTAAREVAAARASLEKLFGAPEPEPKRAYTAEDRARAQLYGWDQWEEVAAHYDEDPDDALDLYGKRLCSYAVGKAAQLKESYV